MMNTTFQSKSSAELGAIIREANAFLDRSKGHVPQLGETQDEIDRNNQQREWLEVERLTWSPESYTEKQRKIHDYTRPCADPACDGCTENDHYQHGDVDYSESGCNVHPDCSGYTQVER